MSVINNYVDTNILAGKLAKNTVVMGGQLKTAIQSFAIAATDEAGSVYRVFKGLSPDIVIKDMRIFCDALAGVNDVDVGVYGVLDYDGIGAIVDGNCIGDAVDISAGFPITAAPGVLDEAIAIADREKALWELAGEAQFPAKSAAYDICLTVNAIGQGTNGNVCVIMSYVQM